MMRQQKKHLKREGAHAIVVRLSCWVVRISNVGSAGKDGKKEGEKTCLKKKQRNV